MARRLGERRLLAGSMDLHEPRQTSILARMARRLGESHTQEGPREAPGSPYGTAPRPQRSFYRIMHGA